METTDSKEQYNADYLMNTLNLGFFLKKKKKKDGPSTEEDKIWGEGLSGC